MTLVMKAAGFSVTFSQCLHRLNIIVREKSHHETFISRYHTGIIGSEILIILILHNISLLLTLHPTSLEYSSGISMQNYFQWYYSLVLQKFQLNILFHIHMI